MEFLIFYSCSFDSRNCQKLIELLCICWWCYT